MNKIETVSRILSIATSWILSPFSYRPCYFLLVTRNECVCVYGMRRRQIIQHTENKLLLTSTVM